MQIDKHTTRTQLIERLVELLPSAFVIGESGGGQNPKVEARFRELEDAQDLQCILTLLPTAPEREPGERHLSEVFRIVEGATRGDMPKVKAYAGLLAEKLDAEGEANSARWLRRIIEGKAGAVLVPLNVAVAEGWQGRVRICAICFNPITDHNPRCTEDVWAEHQELMAKLRDKHTIGTVIEL